MCLHLDICIVVFGSFRGDSNSVMDLSRIDQDKMLPDVSLVNPAYDIFIHISTMQMKPYKAILPKSNL